MGKRPPGAGGVIAVVVVIVVAIGALAFVAARSRDDNDAASGSTPSGPDSGSEPTETEVTQPPRTPVDAGGITFSMAGEPDLDSMSVPAGDGTQISAEVWLATVPGTDEDHAEIAFVFALEGRSYDLESGLRGAVSNTGGTIIDGPSPLVIGGQDGLMAVGTAHNSGVDGYVRVGGFVLGDQAFIVAYVNSSADVADGEQGFADLVASVHVA